MYIKTFIEKHDGSPVFVDFEGVRYIFQKNQWGDAVSFVGNQRHQARLLAMGEGSYIEYQPPEDAEGDVGAIIGAKPVVLGPDATAKELPREPLPDGQSVDEALTEGEDRALGPEPTEDEEGLEDIKWAPNLVDNKIREFKNLNDVNFIEYLSKNKDRIMNWPIVVRKEIAAKIKRKLPAYDPEKEGIEGFVIDDYLG